MHLTTDFACSLNIYPFLAARLQCASHFKETMLVDLNYNIIYLLNNLFIQAVSCIAQLYVVSPKCYILNQFSFCFVGCYCK